MAESKKANKANKANTSAKKCPRKSSPDQHKMTARCKAEKAIARANTTVKRCKEFSTKHTNALIKLEKLKRVQKFKIRNAKKDDKKRNDARKLRKLKVQVQEPLPNRPKPQSSKSLPEILLQSGKNLARVHPEFFLAEEHLRARAHPTKTLANIGKLRMGAMESAKDYVGRLHAQEETMRRKNERRMNTDMDLARRLGAQLAKGRKIQGVGMQREKADTNALAFRPRS